MTTTAMRIPNDYPHANRNPGLSEIREVISPCRSGSTAILKFFSQDPANQAAYQPVKAGWREKGIPDYTLFEIASNKRIVTKETFGPHNFCEASFTAVRSESEFQRIRPVFLIRDPVDTFNSWMSEGWEDFGVFEAAWQNLYRHFQIGMSIDQNCHRVIRYEDLVTDPKRVLEAVCQFWEYPFDLEMLTMSKPINLDPNLPGTKDFMRSQKDGSFSNAEKLKSIQVLRKKAIIPEAIKTKILAGRVMDIYSEMSAHAKNQAAIDSLSMATHFCANRTTFPWSTFPAGSVDSDSSAYPLIIATVGPSCNDDGTMLKLMTAGADILRLNYSHGSFQSKEIVVDRIRRIDRLLGRSTAIMADIPGPKIRLGAFPGEISLRKDEVVELHCGIEQVGDLDDLPIGPTSDYAFPVGYEGLSSDLKTGDSVFISDGLIKLVVIGEPCTNRNVVVCQVEAEGDIIQKKGGQLPGLVGWVANGW